MSFSSRPWDTYSFLIPPREDIMSQFLNVTHRIAYPYHIIHLETPRQPAPRAVSVTSAPHIQVVVLIFIPLVSGGNPA